MKTFHFASLASLACAPTALALASFSPVQNGPTYSVGLPPNTKISSSSPGEIYFSLEAPDTYQWAGLGIGGQMAGATIFMMYPNGKGNVTISAREGGAGQIEPTFNSSLMAGVTLLEGSGVSGGVMRANVKCTTCSLDSSATSTKSPWIAAYLSGNTLTSTDESVYLDMHNLNTMFQFTFDLTAASLSSDANPFVASGGKPTSSGSAPTGSPSAGSSSSGSTSGSSSGSSFGGISSEYEMIPTYQRAHGVLMGTAILVLFPVGAVFMRVVGSPLLHGIVQVLALGVVIGGFAIGIKLANILDYLYKGPGHFHTTFGTVIVAILLIQPFIGLAHHFLYKKTGGRTPASHMHIWLGRIVLICGAINGGFGLKLAANSKTGEIVWGVVAGVVALLYAVIVIVKRKSGKDGRKVELTS